MDLAKRYAFLEMVVGSIHGHLMFFRNGHEVLAKLEAPISDALAIGEHLRGREAAAKVRAPPPRARCGC